jgi:peptide subunit release factor RF-3
VDAREPKMTGFVFKIQANMDPNHRDRIAFMRVCSGKLSRGMKARLARTGKTMALTAPQFFFAQERSIADEAYAGCGAELVDTAAEVFGITPAEVSNEQRRYAKTINFGLIYGMGTFGLAKSLGIEYAAAKTYIDR